MHPSTDGPVILRRVLGEDDRRRAGERDSKRKWRTAKSPDQIARYRARGRRRAEDDDQDHPNFGEEHRQDTISDRGVTPRRRGDSARRVQGPDKARLKCGPLGPGIVAGFIIRQVSQVTSMSRDKTPASRDIIRDSPARNRDSKTGFIPAAARTPATSGVPKSEDHCEQQQRRQTPGPRLPGRYVRSIVRFPTCLAKRAA